ncbi:MAG: AAA family ATPase [Pseudomonadota bacterium]
MQICPGCGEENPVKFKLCGYCGTPLAPKAAEVLPPRELRKTVTIVFSDLKGSTALTEHLDPETMREVVGRYFAAMAAEITRHGGKIEKYIGDAIMAVFGLPRAHEDDALRAVRATAGMQAALQTLNEDLMRRYGVVLANRTGVNTGEVVANDDPSVDQKLATGDAVNVAARLEQAAPENQIYLGEATWRLVRDAVDVERVEPLELKGKSQRVPAFRLVCVRGLDGNLRRQDTPVVGRDAELAALHALYDEASVGRKARLATVVGDAGVGKSRLVHEILEAVAPRARVLRGRCLPYGDGVTFWPLRGMLTEAADIRGDDSPEVAREKILSVVGQADVADRLASAVGLHAAQFPLLELFWAARKFLEGLARDRPCVALLDDIHWAAPAFLDLIEHVLDETHEAPILLLATTRHDLIQERPQWGIRPGAVRLVLRPLDAAASAQVVANLLGAADLTPDVLERIVASSEGNPLYVEQMLSMLIDTGALRQEGSRWVRGEAYGDIAIPPTIQALLEARLDKLQREERSAVDPASVIGLEFAQSAVEALVPAALRASVDKQLTGLTSKQFIHPATTPGQSELRFRFDHHLVRETVYNGLLKRARANLHAEFVRWADQVNAEHGRGLEFEEILGYHLEQAHRYLRELGPLDSHGIEIGNDAARRLSAAAGRAFARGDMHSAASLYRRAIGILDPADATRLALLPPLGETLMELGDFAEADAILSEARTTAEQTGNERVGVASQLVAMLVRLYGSAPGNWSSDAVSLSESVIPMLERADAHDELANAWRLIGFAHGIAGRYGQVADAVAKSISHARAAGDTRLVARSGLALSSSALYGPTPVPEALSGCERMLEEGLTDRHVEATVMCAVAQLQAMRGEFDAARSLYRRGRSLLKDLGQGVTAASTGIDVARVELLAGDLEGADREVRADFEFLRERGETYFASTMAALLSRIAHELGRDDDAMQMSMAAEAATSSDDIESQVVWRAVRVPILSRQGKHEEALELARSAVEMARKTELPTLRADALRELALCLALQSRLEEATPCLSEAIALYAAKGDLVSLARAESIARQWAEAGPPAFGPLST